MENETLEVSFIEKLFIWLRWNLYILGSTLLILCFVSWRYGVPTILKCTELAEIESKVQDLAMAMSEVQDVQVAEAQSKMKFAKR